jgi:hypothetical protein
MKRITQDQFSNVPTPQNRGNCQQAAVASLLGLELAAVPSFHDCQEGFWLGFYNFVKSIGCCVIELPRDRVPNVLYLAYGPSLRGVRHSCVYKSGKLIWDPHPSRDGLVEVDWVNLIVPFDPGGYGLK